MKTVFKHLIMVLWLSQILVGSIFAKEQSSATPIVQSVRLERIETYSEKAPRTLFLDFIVCHYAMDYIEIEVPDCIETLYVTISKNDVIVWDAFFNQVNNTAQLQNLSGTCQVTCSDANGRTFQGVLIF